MQCFVGSVRRAGNEMNEAKPKSIGRVTIRTVAEDARVSVAAVSKVLRNAYGVSEAMRVAVGESIERLGYRPSIAARGMRGQTLTIGVLLVGIDNPFLPQVFAGIADVADRAGYKVLMGVGASRMPLEATLIEQMIDNHMDGLVLVAAQIAGRTLEKYARQIPIAVIGHHEPTAQSFDTVNCNDALGAAMAVRALYDRGYRDIGMVGLLTDKTDESDVSPQREIGFARAIADLGLGPARFLRVHNFDPDRLAKIAAHLVSSDRPRALFVWSYLDGITIMNIARQVGLRVPEDLALIAFDNSTVAALTLIDLASMDQSGPRLGQLATEALLTRIAGRTVPHHLLLEPTVVLRSSL